MHPVDFLCIVFFLMHKDEVDEKSNGKKAQQQSQGALTLEIYKQRLSRVRVCVNTETQVRYNVFCACGCENFMRFLQIAITPSTANEDVFNRGYTFDAREIRRAVLGRAHIRSSGRSQECDSSGILFF